MTRRILILCKSAVGRTMSSPGIRASNIARVLAEALPGSSVTLAAAGSCESDERLPYTLRSYAGGMRSLIRASDVVISQGFPPRALDSFLDRTIIMDFFTNFMVEGLEYRAGRIAPAQREAWLEDERQVPPADDTRADTGLPFDAVIDAPPVDDAVTGPPFEAVAPAPPDPFKPLGVITGMSAPYAGKSSSVRAGSLSLASASIRKTSVSKLPPSCQAWTFCQAIVSSAVHGSGS